MQILDWPLLTPAQRANTDAQLRAIGYAPLNGTVDFQLGIVPDYEVAGSPSSLDTANVATTSLGVYAGNLPLPLDARRATRRSGMPFNPSWVRWAVGLGVLWFLVTR